MIETFNFAQWFLLVLPMTLSAGPANVMCASAGASQGFQHSLPFLCGLVIPAFTYSLLVGFGAQSVIETYPSIVTALQYAGALYILYLAAKFLYPHNASGSKAATPQPDFKIGFMLSALNGKLLTMLILMYSVMLREDSTYQEVWLMTIMLMVVGISSNILWMAGGQLLSRFFVSERAIRIQNIVFGVMLGLVAVWMVV